VLTPLISPGFDRFCSSALLRVTSNSDPNFGHLIGHRWVWGLTGGAQGWSFRRGKGRRAQRQSPCAIQGRGAGDAGAVGVAGRAEARRLQNRLPIAVDRRRDEIVAVDYRHDNLNYVQSRFRRGGCTFLGGAIWYRADGTGGGKARQPFFWSGNPNRHWGKCHIMKGIPRLTRNTSEVKLHSCPRS
jgi:hypothetical protein